MESIADFIWRALAKKNVTSFIYLDDIILIGKNREKAQEAYETTLTLLSELGLPVAQRKLCPPTRKLVWLGVTIDLDDNTISIPPQKLCEIRQLIVDTKNRETIPVKHMQSLVGAINHLSKAVPPARLSMARLLDGLRGAAGNPIPVDNHILLNINWFSEYLVTFIGKAIIPDSEPSLTIEADACLDGMGAHDGRQYYTFPVSAKLSETHSISHLECLNCLVAARTLLSSHDRGKTVLIKCDNEATILTYRFGRAKDAVMAACASAMWFLGASMNVNFIFCHVPGVKMQVADALSKVYCESSSAQKVSEIVSALSLKKVIVDPNNLNYVSFV